MHTIDFSFDNKLLGNDSNYLLSNENVLNDENNTVKIKHL